MSLTSWLVILCSVRRRFSYFDFSCRRAAFVSGPSSILSCFRFGMVERFFWLFIATIQQVLDDSLSSKREYESKTKKKLRCSCRRCLFLLAKNGLLNKDGPATVNIYVLCEYSWIKNFIRDGRRVGQDSHVSWFTDDFLAHA